MDIVNLAVIALIVYLIYIATSNKIKNMELKAELRGASNAIMRQQGYTQHYEDDSDTSSQPNIPLLIFILCTISLFAYIVVGLA